MTCSVRVDRLAPHGDAATLPNYAVNATHSAVTARAYCRTRRAVGRARYRERWADETLGNACTDS